MRNPHRFSNTILNRIAALCLLGILFMSRIPLQAHAQQATATANVHVHVTGLRNAKGLLRVTITRDHKNVEMRDVPIDVATNTADFVYSGLQYGSYAIALFHDENKNNKMDSNLIGMPTEGYGFSNNPPRSMGPAKYEDTIFAVDKPDVSMEIKMIYWM